MGHSTAASGMSSKQHNSSVPCLGSGVPRREEPELPSDDHTHRLVESELGLTWFYFSAANICLPCNFHSSSGSVLGSQAYKVSPWPYISPWGVCGEIATMTSDPFFSHSLQDAASCFLAPCTPDVAWSGWNKAKWLSPLSRTLCLCDACQVLCLQFWQLCSGITPSL